MKHNVNSYKYHRDVRQSVDDETDQSGRGVILCVGVYSARMSVYHVDTWCPLRSQARPSDHQKLEFQVVVSHCVGVEPGTPWKSSQCS